MTVGGTTNWLALWKYNSSQYAPEQQIKYLFGWFPQNCPERSKNMDNKNQELEFVEQSGQTMNFLSGLIIGGLVGAVTMLLMAPQPGEKTRAELQSRAIELRDQTATTMKDTMAQVKSKANQIKADVQIKAQDLGHQGQELLVKQLDNVSHAAEAGKKALQGSTNHTVV